MSAGSSRINIVDVEEDLDADDALLLLLLFLLFLLLPTEECCDVTEVELELVIDGWGYCGDSVIRTTVLDPADDETSVSDVMQGRKVSRPSIASISV